MMDIDINAIVTTIGTILATILATYFGIKRKLSKDNVERVKDSAEANLITVLEEQRNKAILTSNSLTEKLLIAEREKLEAINKVSQLSDEVENLSGQIKILKDLVERLGSSLDSTRVELREYAFENAKLAAKLEVLEKQ